MPKYFIPMFIAISFFASFGFISKSALIQNQTVFITPTITPTDDSASLLYLDRVELKIPAPPGYGCSEKCDDGNMIINVRARGINVKEWKNVYKYKVSGGRVLDEGKNIRWDLAGAKPGTYTITVAVGDGKKIKEATGTIIVRDCDCFVDCSCPTISVAGESEGKAGEIITFTANISGGTAGDVTYDWTISQGEIVDGQGTPKITVVTSSAMTGTVKATVEIGGMCADCARIQSAITKLTK